MSATAVRESDRRFSVRARHLDRHHSRVVAEPSFEAAAIAYVEHLAPEAGEDTEVGVIVRDLENGEEHCFRVDLGSGDAAACDDAT